MSIKPGTAQASVDNKGLRVSFGVIVLNGHPFIEYNLRSLYPHAHEIIVVEGAAPAAAAIASADGHSVDGTLESVRRFMKAEDPEGKVLLVTAEDEGHPSGFWPGEKDEQSQAYASRATGNCLWQVDVDEFYRPSDFAAIRHLLTSRPDIQALSVKQITFWGHPDVACDGWYLRRGAEMFDRVFRWGRGYRYVTHRAALHMGPVLHDPEGQDLRRAGFLDGEITSAAGIRMFHYSLLFPQQVRDKAAYYRAAPHSHRIGIDRWAGDSYFSLKRPFRVHNMWEFPSWLEHNVVDHPPEIQQMWADIRAGKIDVEVRDMSDAWSLLRSRRYTFARAAVRACESPDRLVMSWPRKRWRNLRSRLSSPTSITTGTLG